MMNGSGSRFYKCALRAAAIVAMLQLLSPALSQTEMDTGSHVTQPKTAEVLNRSKLSPEDRAETTIVAFSQCVIMKRRAVAEHVLTLNPVTGEQSKALSDLATSDCLEGGDLRMDWVLMRGGFFAALYRMDFRNAAPALGAKPVDFVGDVPDLNSDDAKQYVALRQFADCVVRDDPADSRSFILSGIGSSSQNEALAALSPHFGPCLLKNSTFSFSKSALYSFLAEALYRESMATIKS